MQKYLNDTEIKLKHFQKNSVYETLLNLGMQQKSHPLEDSAENTYPLRWDEDMETPAVPGIDLIYESKMRMVTRYCIMKEIGGIFFKTGKH